MANIAPNVYIGGFQLLEAGNSSSAPGIFFPLSSLPSLNAGEVDGMNGDIRKVLYEINRAIFTAFTAMDAANKPTKFSITRATPTGVNPTTVRQSYTTSFDLAINDVDVAPE